MVIDENELKESIHKKNVENFNKNGGINMYLKDEEDDEIKTKKDEVLEKIKEIDSKYVPEEYVPTEIELLELEKREFTAPTDEELENQAIESLKTYKENEIDKIDDKYSSKFIDISEDVEKTLNEKEGDISSINTDYETTLKKTKDSSVKKGVARSSIYENALREIEGEKESNLDTIEQEYNKVINSLKNERDILQSQKESALTSFDISYAVKLQSKIDSLNTEIAKEQEKVLKYNKDIEKQEADYIKEQEKLAAAEQKKVEEKNSALQKLIDKKGQTEIQRLKAEEKYNVFYDYLSSISKADAVDELKNDPVYKNDLGSYYNLLYAQMLKRKD
ncbi:MAG: hypothetical protein PHS54_02275 [Clostridia bacterium]|nr:hypothetical protein [Clostridia bacterium]